MNTSAILITLSGPDKPGMVSALSEVVASHDGNWLESRMANLGGQFAGILRVEVIESRQEALLAALQALDSSALQVSLKAVEDGAVPPAGRELELELLGQDHPGIVRDISRVLSEAGVSVQAFDSWLEDASMAGGVLFHANALLSLPEGLTTEQLHERMQTLSDSLMVDIHLIEPEDG
ncbi:glycine cleavage system protein R [Granulosicoccus sp. 3-233]|uniref:glycine cleavage system protein R n=1 Tax=Granulosicoccus sp. 3-233 TaxID=3417969 RepID=UPI003D341669